MINLEVKNLFERFSRKEEKPVVATVEREEKEIVFSKSVKAGKRMYYLDVKRDRRGDLFLSITESKRKGVTADGQFIFEKHKIFLYKEDFAKFEEALADTLQFIRSEMNLEEVEENQQASAEAVVEESSEQESSLIDDIKKRPSLRSFFFCFVATYDALFGFDSFRRTSFCASSAINAQFWVDRVDITFRNSFYWTFADASTACDAVVGNDVCHSV